MNTTMRCDRCQEEARIAYVRPMPTTNEHGVPIWTYVLDCEFCGIYFHYSKISPSEMNQPWPTLLTSFAQLWGRDCGPSRTPMRRRSPVQSRPRAPLRLTSRLSSPLERSGGLSAI